LLNWFGSGCQLSAAGITLGTILHGVLKIHFFTSFFSAARRLEDRVLSMRMRFGERTAFSQVRDVQSSPKMRHIFNLAECCVRLG
jgi:hypothetical protein